MKNLCKIFTLLLVSLFLAPAAFSQMTLTGEIRPRTEYRHGFKALPVKSQEHALFTEQRTRLNFGYKDEIYKVKMVLQDVRTWGSQSQLVTADGLSSVHEAWGEVFFNKDFSFKFGRQELAYDDHRILGSVGWAQQARSHDVAMLKYEKGKNGLKIHAAMAYNQDKPQLTTNVYSVAKSYKTFQYLWLHTPLAQNLKMSLLFLNNGLQGADTTLNTYHINNSQTIGGRFAFKQNKLKASTAFYFQTGQVGAYTGQDINASDIMVDVNYGITKNFSIGAGFEQLSGTSQTNATNTTNNSFNPLYGTNHKFNGLMDYFFVGNHGNSVGLQDIFGNIKYKKNKMFAMAAFHSFAAAADVNDPNEAGKAMNSNLGVELDIVGGYKMNKMIQWKFGYSQLFGTDTMVALKGGNKDATANWGWIMLSVKPDFLKKKKD